MRLKDAKRHENNMHDPGLDYGAEKEKRLAKPQ